MTALIKTLEAKLFHHRNGVLWVGFFITAAWLVSGYESHQVMQQRLPYAIREVLISYADGLVRRGLGGSVSLWLSGQFGGTPALWAMGMLIVALGALVGLCTRLYGRLPMEPSLVVLVLAPTGLLFLSYDPDGSIRKEILGYLALVLALQGVLARTGVDALKWAVAGGVVFGVSVWIHEAVLVLWPMFACGVALLAWQWPDQRKGLVVVALGVGALSLWSVLYLLGLPARDPMVLCAAVDAATCDGPFRWVGTTRAEGMAYTFDRRKNRDVTFFLALFLFVLVPFLRVKVRGRRWIAPVVIVVACVSVAPLFVVAFDWGRWIHMAVFPLSLLAVGGIVAGVVPVTRLLPSWCVIVFVGSWAMSHASGRLLPAGFSIWLVLFVFVALDWIRLGSIKEP